MSPQPPRSPDSGKKRSPLRDRIPVSRLTDFRARQRQAFADERHRWEEAGLNVTDVEEAVAESVGIELPEGCEFVESPMMGSVWKVEVAEGASIEAGVTGLILEAMKMEMIVPISRAGIIEKVLVSPGAMVKAGDPLLILRINPS